MSDQHRDNEPTTPFNWPLDVDPERTERIDLPRAIEITSSTSPAKAPDTSTDSDLTERIALPVDLVKSDHGPSGAHEKARESSSSYAPTDEPTELLSAPQQAGAPKQEQGLSRLRRSRAGAVIGVLAALLGFGIVVQARSTEGSGSQASSREEDLVRILDDLDSRQNRLRAEIANLQATRQQLNSGNAGSDAALAESRRRLQNLGLLAGTVPATGPGLQITITDGKGSLTADVVLDAIEELRGAGAEAIQMSDATGAKVRIVVSSYFLDGQGGINVDGRTLKSPYTVLAIGDPSTLQTALKIPGGVVDTVGQQGAKIDIQQRDTVSVSALQAPTTPQYARPTS
jgi:uncharacterized protein YlxW (UPF0749 family)